MRPGLKIFKILGIEVRLHYSWWFIFILLSWSLATAFFPVYFPGSNSQTYWLMGITAALLLFVSVLLHELSHSVVARIKNIKVQSITLFFFGGVAGIDAEEMKPSSEFLMAIAGPIFSLILSGIFYVLYLSNGNGVVTAITFYLYQLNFILALFNLAPGYPLDGGRAFRALLYAYYQDLVKATAIASKVGKIFAGFLVALGFLGMFTGIGGGLWFMLIGGFLFFMADLSYSQVVFKSILEQLTVRDLMRKRVKILSPEMSLPQFVKQFANDEDNVFIIKGKNYFGLLDADLVAPIKIGRGQEVKLKQLALPRAEWLTVQSNASAYTAFKIITSNQVNLVPVLDKNQLAGIITARSLMNRIAWELKFSSAKKDQHSRIKH